LGKDILERTSAGFEQRYPISWPNAVSKQQFGKWQRRRYRHRSL